MNDATKKAISDHALSCYPAESCGLVILQDGTECYVPCRNLSATPGEHFVMSPEDYALAEDMGPILAVVHSHPGAPARPSMADKAIAEKSGIDKWVIISVGVQDDGSVGTEDWCEFGPSGYSAPLIGREFVHGVHDCYSIVRDYYKVERGIDLPDFERDDRWWEDGKSNLYMEHFAEAGFVDVGQDAQLQPGDVLLMQIRSKNDVPNHAGIYLGDNVMLHHMHGRLSGRTVWGGMWAHALRTVLRCKETQS
ncbi:MULTISPECIES: C40 family peptidase [unclassified Caballeronia]|uniref:C40 family peptidase n=1 Tax=unclassified Caballeronia TaxID=2646786 RepID=UPI0028565297|nr:MULTISPECIES: C40 family peptidase [unclassified Caballeronia]MDR5774917.1 C40 family peptidase [Caballeronia sp. LZ002]MDR5850353.1 C40 family peptidase [Caballeronia sp. LZ003]